MINFSVIIPNYNGVVFLPDCLNSLLQAIKKCSSSNFEVIMIDNASIDNSCQIFKDFFKKNNFSNLTSEICHLKSNRGFAGAVNQGIKKAKYEYVVLLNNDLTMESNWFQLISKTIENNKDPKIATFFGTVLTRDGTKFESQGLEFFYRGKAKNISNGKDFSLSTINNLRSNQLVWGASAALVVYKKSILKKVGLFDEDFFAYEEDVDLALRLHNLNYKTLYIPKAISYHLGGGTSKTMKNIRSRLSYRNWFFIIIKNYSSKEFFNNFFKIKVERLHNLSYFLKETVSIYKWKSFLFFPFIFFKTSLEILVNLPKMFKKRKVIQKLVKLHN